MKTPVVVVSCVALLFLAACGQDKKDPAVATLQSKDAQRSASASAGPADEHQKALAFAKCLRENGVDAQDPPGPGMTSAIKGDPQDPKIAKALAACQKFAPGTDLGGADPDATKKFVAYAMCMRQHGVNIPDDPSGGMPTLSLSDPTVKQAVEACQARVTGK